MRTLKTMRMISTAAMLAAMTFASSSVAQAGQITGSETLNLINPDVTNLASSILSNGNVNNVTTGDSVHADTVMITPSQDHGDFLNFNGGANYNWGTSVAQAISWTYGQTLTITDPSAIWGSYSGTLISDNNSNPGFRNFSFSGTFTPGSGFVGPNNLANPHTLLNLTLVQNGSAIGGGITLSAAVPEPTTMISIAIGALSAAIAALRRRNVKV